MHEILSRPADAGLPFLSPVPSAMPKQSQVQDDRQWNAQQPKLLGALSFVLQRLVDHPDRHAPGGLPRWRRAGPDDLFVRSDGPFPYAGVDTLNDGVLLTTILHFKNLTQRVNARYAQWVSRKMRRLDRDDFELVRRWRSGGEADMA